MGKDKERLYDEPRDEKKRQREEGRETEPKRPKIEGEERLTGLITKVGDREDQVLNHLMGLTEALLKDIPSHYAHIINQILKSVFTLHHKIGVYSTLTGLLAKRCHEQFPPDSEFPRAAELGGRIVKLTIEMLDRNLVDSVWWKTLLMVQFAAELVHAKVLHPQNMWNLLREIVDEVLSIKNSNNRRDAYCYMVLEALLIVGYEMHCFHSDLKAAGRHRSNGNSDSDCAQDKRWHKPVDFPGLFDDISYFMRNRPNKEAEESTLSLTWKKVQEWHKDGWKACQTALQSKPYMAPELQSRFPMPVATPVFSLKKMRARSAALGKQQAPGDNEGTANGEAIDHEEILNLYISRMTECKKRGDIEDAYRMWNELRQLKDVTPNLTAYLAIFSVCSTVGDTKKAQGYWEEMTAEGIVPTIKAYNALLDVYAQAGGDQMFAKFEGMRQNGVHPDITTFNILAAGFEKMEQPERVTSLLALMRSCKVEPDAQFFAVLIRGCKAGGNVTMCASLWTDITLNYGVEPDKNMYDAVKLVFQAAAKTNLEQFQLHPFTAFRSGEGQVETLSFKIPASEGHQPVIPKAKEEHNEAQPKFDSSADVVERAGADVQGFTVSGGADPVAASTSEGQQTS